MTLREFFIERRRIEVPVFLRVPEGTSRGPSRL